MGKKLKHEKYVWNRLHVNMRRCEDGTYLGSSSSVSSPGALFVHGGADPVEVAQTLGEWVTDDLIRSIHRIANVDTRPPQDRTEFSSKSLGSGSDL
jgi:hypothetical protein